MNTINIRKFGFAFGLTGALLYLGCIIVMSLAGREGTVQFFNSLIHGIDTAAIIRMEIPWWKALIGLVETFILAWLIGACIAGFYNVAMKK
ncbi:hypothetical protein BFP97_16645 [Roseivirga sp. 4D4]|uniref:DUF5676 family membrane protein n=1 Tax=Roseivirga sp. 4D4 TaxID=1889784 RepID=UPI0008536FB9|nr:DUF5676 family membrane protein [Roseivirga sp. 4D4]OEK03914.1 hypothetical protein BFP97_16645 [Roseivirga sp. 4D4]